MKTKYFIFAIGAVIAVSGVWFARAAWRAHRELVSLDVRDVPLAAVLRKIERQTWTTIRAEQSLDARITLHVSNGHLSSVLDRVAEQAGARWSTLYAVYGSHGALNALDSALSGDGRIEAAGWKLLAPELPQFDAAEAPHVGGNVGTPPGGAGQKGNGPAPKMMFHSLVGGGPDQGQLPAHGDSRMLHRGGPGGPVIMEGGPNGEMDIWSAQELVMDSTLTPKLGTPSHLDATADAAQAAAKQVNGKWATYLALKKSKLGIGFGRMPLGPQGPDPDREPYQRFEHLTAKQRVQQARERAGLAIH